MRMRLPLSLAVLATFAVHPAAAVSVTGGIDPTTGLQTLGSRILSLVGVAIPIICAFKGTHAVAEGRHLSNDGRPTRRTYGRLRVETSADAGALSHLARIDHHPLPPPELLVVARVRRQHLDRAKLEGAQQEKQRVQRWYQSDVGRAALAVT